MLRIPAATQLRNFSCRGSELIQDVTLFSKYARYNPQEQRRENWYEAVARSENMFLNRYPKLEEKISWAFDKVRQRQILPSMRCVQFAGAAAEMNNIRMYNCSYTPISDVDTFAEIMYLLLSGSGVGYSVQAHHVAQLPAVRKIRGEQEFVIEDTIEGWAEAVNVLMFAYLEAIPDNANLRTLASGLRPVFNYSRIRPEGAPLVTSGGYAPGSEGLRESLDAVEKFLRSVKPGRKLTPLQCHDIICTISVAVMSGGVRRSSLISLFSVGDDAMLRCKEGSEWFLQNPQRRFSNNSAVIERNGDFEGGFAKVWDVLRGGGTGEPGFFQTNSLEYGTNPCAEVSLDANTFCNLTEIDVTTVHTQKELSERAAAASFIGTLQASFTEFPLLRPRWAENTRRDALIGVGMTGIGTGGIDKLDLRAAAEIVQLENARTAQYLGINSAARCTTIKPSGTTSIILGCTSSGIHAWHNPHFIRRVTVKKTDPLYQYTLQKIPYFVADSVYDSSSAFLEFPIRAPKNENTKFRKSENALEFLQRVARFNQEWIGGGHCRGPNKNNVSATLSVAEHEWAAVERWLIANRERYSALAVLPLDDYHYPQTPFEDIDMTEYARLNALLKYQSEGFDLREIIEFKDETNPLGASACTGPLCDLQLSTSTNLTDMLNLVH